MAAGDDLARGTNDGYGDQPEVSYLWDDRVNRHSYPAPGDLIALWDKKWLLGISTIDQIQEGTETKDLYQCPHCGRADFKERKTLSPKFRCYKCKSEFDVPVRITRDVKTYRTRHDVGWVDLSGALSGSELRRLCESAVDQSSIRPLRFNAFAAALRGLDLGEALEIQGRRRSIHSRGHTLKTVRVRKGQGSFRASLLERYDNTCAMSGKNLPDALEACHLYSFAVLGIHDDCGGLLLRCDLHRLFDQGHLAIHPTQLTIDVDEILMPFPLYASLQNEPLKVKVGKKQQSWLKERWEQREDAQLQGH